MIKRLLLLFLIPVICLAQADNPTRVIVLDVKEGQSVLIQHKGSGWLIDTGHSGQSVNLLRKLQQYGVSNIEGIILTHLHPDHASGYFRLKEAFPSAGIFSNCHSLPHNIQPDTTRWVYEALKNDKHHQCLGANDKLDFYNVKMSILWPYEFINNNLNHHSLVINIAIGGKNILVMGDADYRAEQELISKNTLPSNVSALIVGHHGANDASGATFLKSIKPGLAIISTNKDNIRGYPSDSTIRRLKSEGITIMQTSIHKDIIIPLHTNSHE